MERRVRAAVYDAMAAVVSHRDISACNLGWQELWLDCYHWPAIYSRYDFYCTANATINLAARSKICEKNVEICILLTRLKPEKLIVSDFKCHRELQWSSMLSENCFMRKIDDLQAWLDQVQVARFESFEQHWSL